MTSPSKPALAAAVELFALADQITNKQIEQFAISIDRHFQPYLDAVEALRAILNGEDSDKGLVDGSDWINGEEALAKIDAPFDSAQGE